MPLTRSYTPSIYKTKGSKKNNRKLKAKKTVEKLYRNNPGLRSLIDEKAKKLGIAIHAKNKPFVPRNEAEPYKKGMGKEFYFTREWRKLRYDTLRKYGAKCACCGVGTEHGTIMHVDHINPRSKHPELELDPENLQVLCEACNEGKSNLDNTDWRSK